LLITLEHTNNINREAPQEDVLPNRLHMCFTKDHGEINEVVTQEKTKAMSSSIGAENCKTKVEYKQL